MKISLYNSSKMQLEANYYVKMLKEAGFNTVDFGLEDAWSRPKFWQGIIPEDTLFLHSDEEVMAFYKPIIDKYKSYGMELYQGHAPFPSGIPDRPNTIEYAIKVIKRTVRIASLLGVKHLVVHGDSLYGWDKVNTIEDINRLNWELYSSLVPELMGTNVTICLENMFGDIDGIPVKGHVTNAKDTCDFIDALNALCMGETHFGFCLDNGHLDLAGVDVYPFIKKLGKRIKCLHLQDNFGVYKDTHYLPYFGTMDHKDLLRGLRDIGYDGSINFEVSAFDQFPKELHADMLNLLYKVGEYFYKAIKGLEEI